jgi:hypothetical protein
MFLIAVLAMSLALVAFVVSATGAASQRDAAAQLRQLLDAQVLEHARLSQQSADRWRQHERELATLCGAVGHVQAAQAAQQPAAARRPAKKKPRVFSRIFDR